MDGDWATLSASVTEVLSVCGNDKERQTVIDRTAAFSTKLAKLTHDVQAKADAHKMLASYLDTYIAAEEKASQIPKRIQDEHLTADEMSQLRADVDAVCSLLSQLEPRHPEMKAVMDKASLVMKDRTTQDALDLNTSIQKLLDYTAQCSSELDVKAEKLAKVSEAWLAYSDSKTSVQRDLQELQESISAAEVKELSLAGVRMFLEHLLVAQQCWSETSSSYERLKSAQRQLAVLDPSSVDKHENEFGQIEADRNALQSALLDSIHSAAVVIESWQSYDKTKNNVEAVCTKAKSLLLEPVPLCSLQALQERLSHIKVFCYIYGRC